MLSFLALPSLKTTVAVATGALVLGAVTGAYFFVSGLQTKVEKLEAQKTLLEAAVEVQRETVSFQQKVISEWSDAQKDLLKKLGELSRVTVEAAGETRRLYATFTEHDLGALAEKKPGLIERRINDGSARSNRMLECASGDVDACRNISGETEPAASAP